MYVVLDGEVQLARRQPKGQKLILQRAKIGHILAEASLFADTYHCDGIAVMKTSVRCFARYAVLRRFETDLKFAKAWAAHLANEICTARFRAEMLSQRTVAGRLHLWQMQNGGLPVKGSWKQLAAEMGISPEALYRQLTSEKRDGR